MSPQAFWISRSTLQEMVGSQKIGADSLSPCCAVPCSSHCMLWWPSCRSEGWAVALTALPPPLQVQHGFFLAYRSHSVSGTALAIPAESVQPLL